MIHRVNGQQIKSPSSSVNLVIGSGFTFLNIDKEFKAISPNFTVGVGFENEINSYSSLNILINYYFKNQQPFNSVVYDYTTDQNYTLRTRFQMGELNMPIYYCLKNEELFVGLGVVFNYLLHVKSNQEVIGEVTTFPDYIKAKYKLENDTKIGMYNLTNYAPMLMLGYEVNTNFSLNYFISIDVKSDPFYGYINQYNHINNQLLLKFKIH